MASNYTYFSTLVDAYSKEFEMLFSLSSEQQSIYERNIDSLRSIKEKDQLKIDEALEQNSRLSSIYQVVFTQNALVEIGISIIKWTWKEAKRSYLNFNPSKGLIEDAMKSFTDILKLMYVIVGSFRMVLNEGLCIPNNKNAQKICSNLHSALNNVNKVIADTSSSLLEEYQLKCNFEIPNRLQPVDIFVLDPIWSSESDYVSKHFVNLMADVVETTLANSGELFFLIILTSRVCKSKQLKKNFHEILEDLTQESKEIFIDLEGSWTTIIKESEGDVSEEKEPRDNYIKKIRFSKEFIFLKETSNLRQHLKNLDKELQDIEKMRETLLDRKQTQEVFRQQILEKADSYLKEASNLKITLERNMMQLKFMQKADFDHTKPSTSSSEGHIEKNVSHKNDDELSKSQSQVEGILQLEYANDGNDEVINQYPLNNLEETIGDEFFQTRGGLGLDTFELETQTFPQDQHETMFKFVVNELKGKLTDVSVVMKERERKAKRRMYGEEGSSDSEDEEVLEKNDKTLLDSQKTFQNENAYINEIFFNDSYNIESDKSNDLGNGEPSASLAEEGFPISGFFHTELAQALKLRESNCVMEEEYAYSDEQVEED